MLHEIKLNEAFADAVYNGEKNFEIRRNDRGYQKGDLVRFRVIRSSIYNTTIPHPLNDLAFKITYVISGWGIEDGFVVFGIAKEYRLNKDGEIVDDDDFAEFEEVVHCGECKYADDNLFCTLHSCNPTESDFCSWGERE